MKKSIFVLIVGLGLITSLNVYASDLSSTTMGLNQNEIDWMAGPNLQFNDLAHDYLIGVFGNQVGTLGYYKAGDIPFSFGTSIYAEKYTNIVSEETTKDLSYTVDYPFASAWYYTLFGTVGFKSVSNLSLGSRIYVNGLDGGSTKNPSVGSSVTTTNYTNNVTIAIPFGLSLGSMYNYANFTFYHFTRDFDNNVINYSKKELSFSFLDRLTMPSLIPGGTETSFSVSINAPRLTAHNPQGSTFKSGFAVSAANRFDKNISDGINLALNPEFEVSYANTNAKKDKKVTTNMSYTLSCATSFTAKFPGTPITLFAGAMPSITVNTTDIKTTKPGDLVEEQKGHSFYTNLYTSGMGGLSFELPADVTINFTVKHDYKEDSVKKNAIVSLECVIPFK